MTSEELQSKYPLVFPVRPSCGVDFPVGWSYLLDKLCRVIQFHLEYNAKDLQGNFQVEQIKTKFSSLRFYVSGGDQFIRGAISLAESMSGELCTVCGKPGAEVGDWTQTFCKEGTCGTKDTNSG